MLVLAQVSSMNTSRRGSSRPWYFLHCSRRRATLGRSCSTANSVFFERHSGIAHDPPHRTIARHHAPLAQLDHQPAQRQVRNRLQTTQQPLPLTGQRTFLLAPHRPRRRAPGRSQPLRPLHRARHAHPKQTRRLASRAPRDNRRRHTLPKIVRIRSHHSCWPPSPAGRLNQNSEALGIPLRFRTDESDSMLGSGGGRIRRALGVSYVSEAQSWSSIVSLLRTLGSPTSRPTTCEGAFVSFPRPRISGTSANHPQQTSRNRT